LPTPAGGDERRLYGMSFEVNPRGIGVERVDLNALNADTSGP